MWSIKSLLNLHLPESENRDIISSIGGGISSRLSEAFEISGADFEEQAWPDKISVEGGRNFPSES